MANAQITPTFNGLRNVLLSFCDRLRQRLSMRQVGGDGGGQGATGTMKVGGGYSG